MKYSYKTQMTCSSSITFELENNILHNIHFTGGCDGNLKAVSKLAEGMDADEFVARCGGITCGRKPTSCSDQFSRAIREAQEKLKASAAESAAN
ncbi:MAG: TIGR03905 family TSCPD domain-containing protein [Eubacteriales bacterium]